MQSSSLNGYRGKVGDIEILRVIKDGIRYGARYPLFSDSIKFHTAFKSESNQSVQVVHSDQDLIYDSLQASDKILSIGSETPSHIVTEPLTTQDLFKASTTDEINNEVLRVLQFALNAQDLTQVIKLPTGTGKTRTALELLSKQNIEGKTVLYLVPNHKIVNEVVEELSKCSVITPLVIEGQMRQCQLYQDTPELRPVMDQLRGEGIGIPQLCSELRCPFFDECATRARQKRDLNGQFVIAAHAMLSHLKEIPDDAILVIDESPPMLFTERSPFNRLWSLIATPEEREAYKQGRVLSEISGWRAEHYPTLGSFLELLLPLLESEVKTWMGRSTGYALESDPLRLGKLTKPLKQIASSLVEIINELTVPKGQRGALARSILSTSKYQKFTHPRPSTLRLCKLLIELTAGHIGDVDIRLVVGAHGDVQFETRTPLRLPPDVKTWILDATPNMSRLQSLSRFNERDICLVEGDQKFLRPHISRGVWLDSNAYRSSRLFNDDRALTDEGLGALRTLSTSLEPLLSQYSKETVIGIGTHKSLAKYLNAALNDSKAPQSSDGSLMFKSETFGANNVPLLNDHPLIGQLQRFNKVIIGHTGRDNNASNRFNDCQALILIGSPRMDLRSSRADAISLSPSMSIEDLNSDYDLETENALRQWIGRLRLSRRSGCTVMYAGDVRPPHDLGISWSKESVSSGRPKTQLATQIEAEAIDILSRGLSITKRLLIQLGASVKVARGVISRLRVRSGVEGKRGLHGQVILAMPRAVKEVASMQMFQAISSIGERVYQRVKSLFEEQTSFKRSSKISARDHALNATGIASLQLSFATPDSFTSPLKKEIAGWSDAWLTEDVERPSWYVAPPDPDYSD